MKTEVNIFKSYKDQLIALSCVTLLSGVLNVTMGLMLLTHECEVEKEETIVETVEVEEVMQMAEMEPVEPVLAPKHTTREIVYFTNYYTGSDGSTNRTGSGLTTNQFQINERGWYTYQGKVVVAAATNEGLRSNYGVLSNYSEPEEEITYYNYYDEFQIRVEGVTYDAIVLDTCGASMNIDYLYKHDDGINRIDIFIAGKEYSFGKVKGTLIK